MEISFSDARLCTIFNSIDRLSERYGKDVAQSIAVRMAVLAGAPALSHIPRKPPIGLKVDGQSFTVDLRDNHRLRFEPATPRVQRAPEAEDVTRITILGVEP